MGEVGCVECGTDGAEQRHGVTQCTAQTSNGPASQPASRPSTQPARACLPHVWVAGRGLDAPLKAGQRGLGAAAPPLQQAPLQPGAVVPRIHLGRLRKQLGRALRQPGSQGWREGAGTSKHARLGCGAGTQPRRGDGSPPATTASSGSRSSSRGSAHPPPAAPPASQKWPTGASSARCRRRGARARPAGTRRAQRRSGAAVVCVGCMQQRVN